MTTYTVLNPASGEAIDSGLTAVEAMREVLFHDGHEYEIRPAEGGGYELWTTNFSRASTAYNGLSKSSIWSIADDEAEAEAEIAAKVIAAGWRRKPDVMTDADYEAMRAED